MWKEDTEQNKCKISTESCWNPIADLFIWLLNESPIPDNGLQLRVGCSVWRLRNIVHRLYWDDDAIHFPGLQGKDLTQYYLRLIRPVSGVCICTFSVPAATSTFFVVSCRNLLGYYTLPCL